MAEIDLSALMQQAQELQSRMKEMQDTASARTVEAQSGGGMVRVVVDGYGLTSMLNQTSGFLSAIGLIFCDECSTELRLKNVLQVQDRWGGFDPGEAHHRRQILQQI